VGCPNSKLEGLTSLEYFSSHPTKIANMDIIISKFPWNPRATNIYFKPKINNPKYNI
jgi:hypothetical protein